MSELMDQTLTCEGCGTKLVIRCEKGWWASRKSVFSVKCPVCDGHVALEVECLEDPQPEVTPVTVS